jgi:hypothetical protein
LGYGTGAWHPSLLFEVDQSDLAVTPVVARGRIELPTPRFSVAPGPSTGVRRRPFVQVRAGATSAAVCGNPVLSVPVVTLVVTDPRLSF